MKSKVQEKEKAIELRRKGLSYNDILKEVQVARSSLSSWLKDLPLSDDEKKYLKHRKDSNISRGRIKAAAVHVENRIRRDQELFIAAKQEFFEYTNDPFFFVGVSLYWAEGTKRSGEFNFTNSDPEMIQIMVLWIKKYFGLTEHDITARLYTHKPFAHENQEVFWARTTSIPMENFKKTVYKVSSLPVKKRPNYQGCLRIRLGRVLYFKKMLFWQQLLVVQHLRGLRL